MIHEHTCMILYKSQWRSQNAEKYTHQMETTGSNNDSLQLRALQMGLLLREKQFAPRGSEFFLL